MKLAPIFPSKYSEKLISFFSKNKDNSKLGQLHVSQETKLQGSVFTRKR